MNSPRPCRRLIEGLFPSGACLLCGEDSGRGPLPGLCAACWRKRRRPGTPACPVCGVPLPAVEDPEPHPCGACLADPPAYERHISAFVYSGPVRLAVLLYKDQRRYALAGLLGRAVARRVRKDWPDAPWEAVVFVPSPWRRRMVRGFEPAGLMAEEAAKALGLPCRRWLEPRKAPVAQKGLTRAARRQNLRGAFTASGRCVEGRRLLLLDDVCTTGATLREASRVLARHGAVVDAATFAMVLSRPLDLAGAEPPPEEGGTFRVAPSADRWDSVASHEGRPH